MTDDGYPTDEELAEIRSAAPKDVLGLARAIWNWGDTMWRTKPAPRGEVGTYHCVSTGGWSGNEDIIGAMHDNTMFWLLAWVSSKRGGHFEFCDGRFAEVQK